MNMADCKKTEKLRKVAIAIDGSKHSMFAFEWYVKNLYRVGDEVSLIYSVDLNDALYKQRWFDAPYSFDVDNAQKMMEEEKKNISKKEMQFQQLLTDAKIDGHVRTTQNPNIGLGICELAKEINADYIVVGTRGLGKIRRTLLGSVSEYVIHHSHIPVVVCHK